MSRACMVAICMMDLVAWRNIKRPCSAGLATATLFSKFGDGLDTPGLETEAFVCRPRNRGLVLLKDLCRIVQAQATC